MAQTINIKGHNLHSGQYKLALHCSNLINEQYRHTTVLKCARQWGKSFVALQILLFWAFSKNNQKLAWISPTYKQATKVYRELEEGLSNSGTFTVNNKGELRIVFVNGSEVIFLTAENPDAIRGYSFNYVICDEFAYYKENVWSEAIEPTLKAIGKHALLLSTPKGKNIFYKLYNLGLDNDNKYIHSITGHNEESPFYNAEELEFKRKQLPEHIFRQEWLGEFIEDGGTVFVNLKNAATLNEFPKPSGKCFAGIDLGNQNDYTVMTILDEHNNLVDIYRANHTTWTIHEKEILDRLHKYKPEAYIEVNFNSSVYERLYKQYKNINPFDTTKKSKPQIIEDLILEFQENRIHIPTRTLCEPLYIELEMFSYEYNPKTRYISYAAPKGFHDDCVMSLAIANYARKSYTPRRFIVMGGG